MDQVQVACGQLFGKTRDCCGYLVHIQARICYMLFFFPSKITLCACDYLL